MKKIFLLSLFLPALAAADTLHGDLKISQAWTRATPPGAQVAGVYANINNQGKADRLLSAHSPQAQRVELHSMRMNGSVMEMRKLDKGLPLPTAQNTALQPGGAHLMLFGLKTPLRQGEKLPLTLKFEQAGEVNIEVAVEAMGASGPAHKH